MGAAQGIVFANTDGVDRGVIRLVPGSESAKTDHETARVRIGEPRRGFDYSSFGSRLESLWFQRKTLLASGREQDAALQLEKIRALCSEEGIKRLEHIAGALVSESRRYLDEGNGGLALSALHYAEVFDPGRPQTHLARADVHWRMGRAVIPAATELFAAGNASIRRSIRELGIFHRLAFVLGLALIGTGVTFALVMVLRYQVPFRHEVEEWSGGAGGGWPRLVGWVALVLPIAIWFGAGWAAVYWLVVVYRFMSRMERLAAVSMLLLGAVAWPVYGLVVGLYGTTADPAVRTTLASVDGEYDRDRIVRLKSLVESHPEDPVYRFLLAGLYKNGRYFEEAFDEYRKVIDLEPSHSMAWVNIGNIFCTTGQHAEAIANYNRALDIEPDNFLAHFNMHLAQSEDFRFSAAEDSLARARGIDAARVTAIFARFSGRDSRLGVQDSMLELAPLWEAAVAGRATVRDTPERSDDGVTAAGPGLLNPGAVSCGGALALCFGLVLFARRPSSRRCNRCGRAFCNRCKRGEKAPDSCTQCMHLFVLRDGLAPETKSKKLYEVARHETRSRLVRRVFSLFVPGSVQIDRGQTSRGLLLVLVWWVAWVAARPDMLPVSDFAGLSLSTDLLSGSIEVPSMLEGNALMMLGAVSLPLIWLAGNLWQFRRRGV